MTNTVNAWNSGLKSEITITNIGSTPLTAWSLVFTLPSGQTNASYSPSSGQVLAKNAPHNGDIAPTASVGFGFQTTHTGDTSEPTSYVLNSGACAIA